MMRSVTAGLGALTILAVTGAITTSGQTFLGFKPSPRDQSAVTVIKDAPAATSAAPKAPVAPVAARPVSHAAPAAAQRPAVRPAAAPAASAAPAPGGLGTGLGQAVSIANILLNLPQILTHPAQPAPGYVPRKKHLEDDGHDQ